MNICCHLLIYQICTINIAKYCYHCLLTRFLTYYCLPFIPFVYTCTLFNYQVFIIILFTNQVCTKEEQEVLARGSRKSEQLRQRLMKDRGQDDYEKAVQHKNKLLEFDKTRSGCVVFVMLENLQKY